MTPHGRNLITLGIVAVLVGLVMLSTGIDAGRWVAIGGLVAATLGGFTSRVTDEG
jgi:hypothetical protein